MNYKDSTHEALLRASEKALKDEQPKEAGRKNKKPEQDAVREICRWLKNNDFKYNVIEAKGVFDPDRGSYKTGRVARGFSDIIACDPHGFACYIEVKAKGKLSTLKEHQYEFLHDSISHNAFAGVFDSAESLAHAYNSFYMLRRQGKSAVDVLIDLLPDKFKTPDTDPLFED